MGHWWLFFKGPLIICCIIAFGLILLDPIRGLILGTVFAVLVVPWFLFARWLCKEIDRSKKFNHRK